MIFYYYLPGVSTSYVYMLQTVEYDARKFLKWLRRLPDLRRVQRRGRLTRTTKAKALIALCSLLFAVIDIAGVALILTGRYWQGIALIVLSPVIVAGLLAAAVSVSSQFLMLYRRPLLGQAKRVLAEHQAIKVAVLGSYGKTTMKELLLTVLGEARRVQATPGNMNVPISHARWITSRVDADTEILIFEYGEGEPGDITRFAKLTNPDYAVVTGMAPNHLDRYANFEALATDLTSISQFVPGDKLFVHDDNSGLAEQLADAYLYDEQQVAGWQVEDVAVSYDGVRFTMRRNKDQLNLHSPLLGRHQVGPLAAVAAIALELGLTPEQVSRGIANTRAFAHRMQARQLQGAWIIDDTYNGNLEGIRAGLQLLNDLDAKRKIYVTPGLVDQGRETARVHTEVGRLIAEAAPNKVVLMENSARPIIEASMNQHGYSGELMIEPDPLDFYTNIDHTLAAGDLVIMQNDWTDNYF